MVPARVIEAPAAVVAASEVPVVLAGAIELAMLGATIVAVVTVVAGWYGPVWSFFPLSGHGYQQRLFLETWR